MRHSVVICDECKQEFRNGGELNEVEVTVHPGYVLTIFDLCTPCLTKLFSKVTITPRKAN